MNNKTIENILKNSNILKDRYTKCIEDSIGGFKVIEKRFIERLLKEINDYLQNLVNDNKKIDFHKDIKGHYYEVYHICNYEDWPEWQEYLKYIKMPGHFDRCIVHEFMCKSLTKYGLPRENIFDCYDHGWFRYKLMNLSGKNGNLGIGEKYEDYDS